MKRLLTLVCTVALVAFAAQAQAAMYGGIKAGVNMGDLSDVDDTSMRSAFQGGVFVGTQISPEFGFRVEGLWVMKGAKFEEDFGAPIGVVESTVKLDYIEFPLLFVYDFPAGETVSFNLFAGPTLGFNIGAEVEVDGGDAVDVKDDTESFEFGAAIGAGIAKKMASGKAIGLDVRYSLGATTVTKDAASGDPEPKNRGIGIMAFFQVPFGSSAE